MLTPHTAIEPMRSTQRTNMLVRLNVIERVLKLGLCSLFEVIEQIRNTHIPCVVFL